MKKPIILLILLISGFKAFGDKKLEPQIQDLMKALSAHYYERTLPSSVKSKNFVYLTLLNPDGTSRSLGGMSGFEPEETVKVFAFLRHKDPYAVLISEDGDSAFTANGLPKWKAFSQSHKYEGPITSYMIRFTEGDTIPSGEKPTEECFDLIITIESEL